MLFDGIYARGETAAQLSDVAWLQAMLDVEAALAVAVDAPAQAARQIADACRAEAFDVAALATETARNATPVVGLVAACAMRYPRPLATTCMPAPRARTSSTPR